MRPIVLMHWNAKEAAERVDQLRAAGFSVRHEMRPSPDLLRRLAESPPAAIVIDLTRLPSHGREVGIALRHRVSTRNIPLIFAAGEFEKVLKIRQILPDAAYSSWAGIPAAIEQAIKEAPEKPIAPASVFAGYAGTPLPKKLGIKAGFTISLVQAPPEIERALGPLPDSVTFQSKTGSKSQLILWFVRSRKELERGIMKIAAAAFAQPAWIFWPKKTSGLAGDLNQQTVRETGLAAGLVDYKICSFNEIWSGLLFRRRAGK